jgi:hypothetical protein
MSASKACIRGEDAEFGAGESHWLKERRSQPQELQDCTWAGIENEIRKQHRNDLFQVLAYGTLAVTKSVIACLVFPCTAEVWKELQQKGQLAGQLQW